MRVMSSGTVGANPLPTSYYARPPYYAVTHGPEFQDGSRDSNLDSDTGTREFYINYESLTEAEAAILDGHADTARIDEKGESALGYDFKDRDSGTLFNDAHYLRYERGFHVKKRVQQRRVVVVVRP